MASDLEIYVCDTRARRAFARQEARSRCSSSGGDEPDQYGWMEMKVGEYWLHEDTVFSQDLEYTEVRSRNYRKRYSYDVLRGAAGVWIGRMSWTKASVDGEVDRYVPQLVQEVTELFQGRRLVMIDDKLIALIDQCFYKAVPHEYYTTAEREEVIGFLKQHKGKRAFAPNS
jgi:hypothetical protein